MQYFLVSASRQGSQVHLIVCLLRQTDFVHSVSHTELTVTISLSHGARIQQF